MRPKVAGAAHASRTTQEDSFRAIHAGENSTSCTTLHTVYIVQPMYVSNAASTYALPPKIEMPIPDAYVELSIAFRQSTFNVCCSNKCTRTAQRQHTLRNYCCDEKQIVPARAQHTVLIVLGRICCNGPVVLWWGPTAVTTMKHVRLLRPWIHAHPFLAWFFFSKVIFCDESWPVN